MLLKCIIYSLRDILAIPEAAASRDVLEPWLDSDASLLTTDYGLYGLSTSLSGQQVSAGIGDCDDAIDLIENYASELEISEPARASLYQTIEDMRWELLDAP